MDKKKSLKSDSTAQNRKKNNGRKGFLVVGIGASAGGVKALQDFFSTMPPNSGMAFVVILHLSPEHESNLKQIIEAQTNMPVTLVSETHQVKPDNVYVIPPNRQLEMVDGVIRSTAPNNERGTRVAIDVFFRTLAEVYQRNAVCIVLSGTGTDGTIGLKAIKESNGFAIVQDPADAEYDSMPRSAIATQLADWILPVREMPERLINFKNSSERMHLTQGDDQKVAKEIQADESLREILTILRIRTGHDFSNYKTPTLIRRVARHLQIHDLEDIPAYLEFLRENPNEIQSLLKNLLINVTNFFRDKEAWNALEREVVPNLFATKKGSDTIRIWSCGCASGEEAYSLAMLFSEYAHPLKDPPKIQVFATDVDEDAIMEAREHRYPQSIEADVSPDRLKRFFIKEGKYYSIKKELRETVLFAPHNVLRDPPFSRLDLVVCRNLLIYLNRETQERVMEIFHFALAPNGYLFLGNSESAEAVPKIFATVDKKHRIYSRRPAPITHTNAPPKMPVVGRWEVKAPEIKQKAGARPFSLGEVHYKLLESYAPPSILVNQDFEIQYLSETADRYLRFKGGEPSNNLLRLVNPDLLPDLRAALFSAQRGHKSSEFRNVRARIDDKDTVVTIIVRTVEIDHETSDFLLVLFDENNQVVKPKEEKKEKLSAARGKEEAMEAVVLRLEYELNRTKENLRATIEQHEISIEELKASNEELQAINEELRSTTEELETSKEELQSVNEELTTVNTELKEKIDETSRTNSDLQNLMASTEIATIFLDRAFRIKRYTPPVEKLFNITQADIGRPLEHFTHKLDYHNLANDAAEVLRGLKALEREVSDKNSRTYLTRFAPYRTIDDRIEGVVLNFVDITERKKAEKAVVDDLRDTQILRELSARLITNGDIRTVYNQILDAAISIAQADAGTIQMLDEETQELVLLTSMNFPPEMIAQFARVDAGSNTSCGIALKLGKRRFVDFETKEPKDIDGSMKLHREMGLVTAQSTPLLSRSGKPIGMFSTHWRKRFEPTERQLYFLDLLARQASDLIVQRQSEEALRESREKLALDLKDTKQLQRISSLLIEEGDTKALYEQILEAAITVTGADFGSIQMSENEGGNLKLTAWRNFHPESAEFWRQVTIDSHSSCGQALKQGERVIIPDVNADDSLKGTEDLRYYLLSGITAVQSTPLTNREGRLVGIVSTHWREVHTPDKRELRMLDILARQAADVFQRQSDVEALRFQSLLLDTVEQSVIAADLEGKITFWNKYAEELFGWKAEEVIGREIVEVTTPGGDERAKELTSALLKGESWSGEFNLQKRDGTTFPAYVSDAPIFDGEGNINGIVGVAVDITDRKKAEENLRKSEEHLNLILESTRDYAIITYDLKGRITRWNTGAERIFGWTEKETIGRTTHIIFTPEDRAAGVPEMELAKTLETGRAEDERWHIRKDGSRFYASGVMQLLRDGETEGFVKICRDETSRLEAEKITLEKEMLRQLVTAQEDERRRIARDIHDHFGQQITALRLRLDAIQKITPNAEIEDHVNEAQKAAAELDANVDFIAWELRPAALDDLGLRAALANFVHEWSNHTGIGAEFHSTGLNRTRLEYEIETNLYRIAQEALNNIQKHAGAENVSVILEKSRNQVVLIIEDDGIGFNPRDKADRQRGLGLVGMSERAKICGGEIEIESAKGKGTTVFARIPLKKN